MKRRFSGEVISDKMDRSRLVKVEIKRRHPLLGKVVRKYIKVMCHDENNKTKLGDTVVIEETRPLSKKKHFRIVEVKK
ncbi:MAG: 30S ribosomal protein S17 [bacterium (Candidatus Stahlbacteria) CG08_land_8_20_14_0_20_40_26]|nr:MAG: 30S ribosomal protein S17 [bacterium (Candidatus Stahlbacteria) CG23_combo_of_CG06-09_8_20_14_all_40_9]PIS26848.1 MAG: 30S ribosomal protein S17 [bacterium (Candidatus Stahlbacteria) CG08_land_8_20_14_0_20_40_26]